MYQVSNLGGIRSTDRHVYSGYTSKTGRITSRSIFCKGKKLVVDVSRAGYHVFTGSYRGRRVNIAIHKEVARLFCDGYREGLVVDHIDEDKTNNYANNLQWVTIGENISKSHPRHLGRKAAAYTGYILAYDKDTGKLLHTLRGNGDMKEKGFDYRNVSAVLMGKRRYHNGCVFVKVKDKREREISTQVFTKSNFSKLLIIDVDNEEVGCINSYEDLLEKGFTFQKVQRVLRGLDASHRGYTFKIIKDK